MNGATFSVLGLAPPRATWFTELAAWAMGGVVPMEFIKCVSIEEVRARLQSGRLHSALVVDAATNRLDRDVIAHAHEWDCPVIVVRDGVQQRDWTALGADAVLEQGFGRADLTRALVAHARQVVPLDAALPAPATPATRRSWQGDLIAVIGRCGSGVSTLGSMLAQAYGDDPRCGRLVVLADLALEADQAVLHDAVDVLPGLQELVDAHRIGAPTSQEVRRHAFCVEQRGYDLLLGLRRARDWVALRPRAVEATIQSLRQSYRVVVADCSSDLTGESETGSVDIEERNAAARIATSRADVVVAVGTPGLAGTRGLVRQIDALLDHGVEPDRLLTVVNRAPRSGRARAELTRAVHQLVDSTHRAELATPVFVPERHGLDDVHRNGGRLPNQPGRRLRDIVQRMATRAGPRASHDGDQPETVVPGSLADLAGESDH